MNKIHNAIRRPWLVTLTAMTALFIPGVAWAQNGILDPIDPLGVLIMMIAILTIPAAVAFIVSYPLAVIGLMYKKHRTLRTSLLLGLVLLPVAYVSAGVGLFCIELFDISEMTEGVFNAGVAAFACLVQVVWVVGLLALVRSGGSGDDPMMRSS